MQRRIGSALSLLALLFVASATAPRIALGQITGFTCPTATAPQETVCNLGVVTETLSSFNVGNVVAGSFLDNNFQVAATFRTGDAANGYTLNSVTFANAVSTLNADPVDAGELVVAIHEAAGGGPAASALGTLTGNAMVNTAAVNTYTASGITLAKETTYFVVWSAPDAATGATHSYVVAGTTDASQTGDSGWAIGDRFWFKVGANAFAEGSLFPPAFAVLATPTISDATLSALAVAGVAIDSGAGGFMPNINDYFANVPSSFTSAKLTMMTNQAGATVAVTQDGTELSGDFAAGVTSNPLMVGNNQFRITVTAEDGTTMETYTLTVIVDSALKLKLRVFLESALP